PLARLSRSSSDARAEASVACYFVASALLVLHIHDTCYTTISAFLSVKQCKHTHG
ncbi:unnamed protein product, partial [Effrenium voratum]